MIREFFLCLFCLSYGGHCQNSSVGGSRNRTENRLFKCPYSRIRAGGTVRFPGEVMVSGSPYSFGIDSGFKRCDKGNFTLQFDYSSAGTEFNITEFGQVQVGDELYSMREFCLLEFSTSNLKVTVCEPSCQGTKPCIKKCCELGKSMNMETYKCKEDLAPDLNWKPRFYEFPDKEVVGADWDALMPHITRKLPVCQYPNGSIAGEKQVFPSIDLDYHQSLPMRLRKDGSLMVFFQEEQTWEIFPPLSFCVEEFDLIPGSNQSSVEPYDPKDPILLIRRPFVTLSCFNYDEKTNWTPIFYVIALYTSSFFLLLTALVYGILWDKHNVHGWTILFHVISMFLLYVFLGTSNLVTLLLGSDDLMESRFCRITGIVVHFFFISTFCWLTLINIDLWSTFRSHKPAGERSKGKVRFLVYNLIVWGVAFAVVGASVAVDTYFPDGIYGFPAPEYGRISCFIASAAKGYYLYSVIGFLMVINMIFIVLTSWTICKFQENTRMVQNSRSSGGNQSFKLFAKLFIVMGVTWIFEILSSPAIETNTAVYWILCDCINISQGIAIFVIFICKRKSMKQLKQRLSEMCACCGFDSTTTRSTSKSSRSNPSTGTTGTSFGSNNKTSVKQNVNEGHKMRKI